MIILGFILLCTVVGVFIIGKLIEKHHRDIKAVLIRRIEQESKLDTGQLLKLQELGRKLDEIEESN